MQRAKKSFRGAHGERRTRDAAGVEWDAEGVDGVGNVEGVSPPQPTRGLGEHCKLPQRGPGQSPGEKRFYCFLTVRTLLVAMFVEN